MPPNLLTPAAPLSIPTLVVNLLLDAGLSLTLAWYFLHYGKTLSNRASLARILPFISLTTVLIISVVKSSLALSLGLVGALSIVRFRTPIKEPEELAYLFMAIGLGVIGRVDARPLGESNFAKAVMIGIPIGALIGGVATPAGSSINILGIQLIEEHGGVRIPFLDWMALGVPMTLLLLPVACWVVLRFFPPEVDTVGEAEAIRAERAELGPLSGREKKTIALLALMMALWIAGSWVPALSTLVVALAGTIVMFLPGVRLLDWREAESKIAWGTLLMIGGVTSIGSASAPSGLAGWLVQSLLGGMADWPLVWILAAISAFTVVIHLALPVGPVINVVLIPPIALLAAQTGHNPALLALPVAFTASCAMLLPLDPVPLLTYAEGHYRAVDLAKAGTTISVFWVIVMTALMLVIAPLLGF